MKTFNVTCRHFGGVVALIMASSEAKHPDNNENSCPILSDYALKLIGDMKKRYTEKIVYVDIDFFAMPAQNLSSESLL